MTPARIVVDGTEATIDNLLWRTSDELLQEILEMAMIGFEKTGHDPNPDYSAATKVTNLVGGEVVWWERLKYDEVV